MIKNPFTTSKIEETHPSEEELLRCIDGELSAKEAALVRSHLETCWNCRLQLEKIEETISGFVAFRQQIQISLAAPPPNNWNDFNRKLDTLAAEIDSTEKSWWARNKSILGGFFQNFKNFLGNPSLRQVMIGSTAIVLIVVIFWQFVLVKTVSAAELLERASQAQTEQIKEVSQPVVYQKLQVSRDDSVKISLESWGDKTRSRYRQSIGNQANAQFNHELWQLLQSNNFNPQEPLSAITFSHWRKNLIEKEDSVEKIRSENGENLLALRTLNLRADSAGKITEGILKVRENDFHPVEQILRIKTAEGIETYTFTEVDFRVLNLSEFAPDFFPEPVEPQMTTANPDPAASPQVKAETNSNTNSAALESVSKSNAENSVLPKVEAPKVIASADLEVEVLDLLNQAKADLGEQITIQREANGVLYVRGMVESASRKDEILKMLQPVIGNPAVRVEVKTVEEAVAELKNTPKPVAQTEIIESQSERTAADTELLAYFKTEENARAFGKKVIGQSSRAMSRAYALKRLTAQFSQEELRKLSPESRAKWLGLVKTHARIFREETAALRNELQPVFNAPQANVRSAAQINDISDVFRAVSELLDFASTNDRVVRAAFTLSSGGRFSALNTAQFWQSLKNAEAIAEKMQSIK